MTRFNIVGAVVSLLVGAMSFGFFFTRPKQVRRGLPASALASRLQGEVAEARRIGFEEQRRGSGTSQNFRALEVSLGWTEHECVSLIAQAEDGAFLDNVSLRAGAQDTLVNSIDGHPVGRVIAQVQWCTWGPLEITGVIAAQANAADVPARVRWVILRAPWSQVGGPQALTRGVFVPEALATLLARVPVDPHAIVDAGLAEGMTRLALPATVPSGAAVLVPASESTYAALVHASSADQTLAVHPRVVASVPASFDTEGAARATALRRGRLLSPVHDAVCDLGENRFHRVLAVVDAIALGSDCVDVVFIRNGAIALAEVMRFDPTTWHAERVTSVEPRVARDHLCPLPATPRVYLVPDTDQADYRVEWYGHVIESAVPDAGRTRTRGVGARRAE